MLFRPGPANICMDIAMLINNNDKVMLVHLFLEFFLHLSVLYSK